MNYLDYETFKKIHPLAQGLEKEEDIKRCYLKEYIKSIENELSRTDYKAIKYSEGYYTEEEYKPIKEERENLRIRIRELQKELDDLNQE